MATTFKVVDVYRNSITDRFDFNICGGYATDLPATVFNVDTENENLTKVRHLCDLELSYFVPLLTLLLLSFLYSSLMMATF